MREQGIISEVRVDEPIPPGSVIDTAEEYVRVDTRSCDESQESADTGSTHRQQSEEGAQRRGLCSARSTLLALDAHVPLFVQFVPRDSPTSRNAPYISLF